MAIPLDRGAETVSAALPVRHSRLLRPGDGRPAAKRAAAGAPIAMCGIVGIASPVPVTRTETLVVMRDTMRHRGPDDAGVWWSPDGRVGLGHRRLAIIDLTAAGPQPMTDADERAWITFNGEIYNYRDLRRELIAAGVHFRTASDTEVILQAYLRWGDDC